MTAIPFVSADSPPLAWLARHWRLFAILGLGFGPFVPSILAMQDFLLADNALGFTPFALVAAVYLFWQRSHYQGGAKSRDILVDLFFIAPLVATAFFILFVMPGSLSWYFWLNRMDLAALAPWVGAVTITFVGYQHGLRFWPVWMMLFLTWPYPAVALQRALSDVFVPVVAWSGQFVVAFARLPYETSAADPQVFATTHLPDGENFTLIVGQLCSGTSATLGFLIVGAGLALVSSGTAGGRIKWLLVGALVAFVSNLLRVAVLLVVAAEGSRELAVEVVHPVLGIALFSMVILVMLPMMRAFGLRFDPGWRGDNLAWAPAPGGGKALRLVWVLVAAGALGIGAGVVQAQELDFIGIGDGAPQVDVASERGIIPEVPGWELFHETEISWTDLFGRTSQGDVFTYAQPGFEPGDALIGVQTVITDDLSTLERYTIEQCVEFHRRDLEARRAVDLGHGLTGIILHDTYEGVPSSVLYWVMPVNLYGEVHHARIALFGDVEVPTSYEGLEMDAGRPSAATVRLGQTLDTAMDGLPDGTDNPALVQVDRDLVALAVNMIDIMIESGGPGAVLEEEAADSATSP